MSSPSLLFSASAVPPDLLSFPTRRSSDLGRELAEHRAVVLGVRRPVDAGRRARRIRDARVRSEEHTSELQSHSDLVCRLLLEKKKKNRSSTRSLTNSARKRPESIPPRIQP